MDKANDIKHVIFRLASGGKSAGWQISLPQHCVRLVVCPLQSIREGFKGIKDCQTLIKSAMDQSYSLL